MTISYFLTFHADHKPGATVSGADQARFARIVKATPGLAKALLYTPASAHDPYLHDGPPPMLATQLYLPTIETLEAALAPDGHLQALAQPGAFPSLDGAPATQQAMLTRLFPVPDAAFRTPAGQPHCTYLVAYEGRAADLNAWLSHYIAHHPPIMARFPGIRQIEIYTRIDWCGFLPWPRVDYMQRNKVVFDSQEALNAALNSPVRHEMRADFNKFPPFEGRNSHYPMTTLQIVP